MNSRILIALSIPFIIISCQSEHNVSNYNTVLKSIEIIEIDNTRKFNEVLNKIDERGRKPLEVANADDVYKILNLKNELKIDFSLIPVIIESLSDKYSTPVKPINLLAFESNLAMKEALNRYSQEFQSGSTSFMIKSGFDSLLFTDLNSAIAQAVSKGGLASMLQLQLEIAVLESKILQNYSLTIGANSSSFTTEVISIIISNEELKVDVPNEIIIRINPFDFIDYEKLSQPEITISNGQKVDFEVYLFEKGTWLVRFKPIEKGPCIIQVNLTEESPIYEYTTYPYQQTRKLEVL